MNYVYWLRGPEHVELAKLSIASVRKVDSRARIWVYTDEDKGTPHIDGTIRCTLQAGRPAMVANLDAQVLHLLTSESGDQVLFLDSDTLLRKPFLFEPSADLYVTWRDHVGVSDGEKVSGIAPLMPYNYGVVGAVASPRTKEAFIWMRAQILKMSAQHQGWYGNQLALASLVGAAPKTGTSDREIRIAWSASDDGATRLRVRYLPCDVYNWSPEREGEGIDDKVVIHLKGGRKHLMAHYAERVAA